MKALIMSRKDSMSIEKTLKRRKRVVIQKGNVKKKTNNIERGTRDASRQGWFEILKHSAPAR